MSEIEGIWDRKESLRYDAISAFIHELDTRGKLGVNNPNEIRNICRDLDMR